MGNVIVISGADFSKSKSRKTDLQPVEIGTVYEHSYFLNNGQIQPDTAKTAADYPDLTFAVVTSTPPRPWAYDFAMAQCQIPDGAVGICGISNALVYKPSSNSQFNGIPILQLKSNGTAINSTSYGHIWYTSNNQSSGSIDDDTYVSTNTDSTHLYDTLKIIGKVDNISSAGNSLARLLKFVAPIHPDAAYVDLSWVLPLTVTAPANDTVGGSTLGVGLKKPQLYWIFE